MRLRAIQKGVYMIAVVLPTRGLVFTQVEEALEEIRDKFSLRVYRSHDLPIPDGHNLLTRQALRDGCDSILYIEEDTVPPTGSFDKMLAALEKFDLVCVNYGVSGWGTVTTTPQGEILWCGLGCTLVKRVVLEALDYPYFRVDKSLRLNDWTWVDLPQTYIETKQYGSLDIWFCSQARLSGFVIGQVEGECDHLELVQLGERGVNNGVHQIRCKPKITKRQVLEEGVSPQEKEVT